MKSLENAIIIEQRVVGFEINNRQVKILLKLFIYGRKKKATWKRIKLINYIRKLI